MQSTPSPTNSLRLLRCDIGDQRYCLDMAAVLSIVRGAQLIASDDDESGALGWLAWRNDRIPVYHLSHCLRDGNRSRAAGAVIVLQDKIRTWGLAVDSVSRLDELRSDSVIPLPALQALIAHGRFESAVLVNDSLILHLSLERLFPNGAAAPEQHRQTSKLRNPLSRSAQFQATSGGGHRMLLFRIPGNAQSAFSPLFGISYKQVIEVTGHVRAVPLPDSPEHFLGLVPWRGAAVPVLDLGRQLGITRSRVEQYDRLLLARCVSDQHRFAIPIQSDVRGVMLPLPYRTCTRQLPLAAGSVLEVYEDDRDVLVVPDLDAAA